ncbi:MAG: hypothetical protein K2Y28_10355 [Burkholderiaceae bacterium]|nr:hypothetical protein [Burkholderiaceae bacterium]
MRKNKKKLHPWFPAKPKVNGDNTNFTISTNANNAASSIDDAKGEPNNRLDWADETMTDLEREKRLAKVTAYIAANREKYRAAFAKAEQHFVEPADGILAGPRPRRKPTKYLKAPKKPD